jgi:hypothetical protein
VHCLKAIPDMKYSTRNLTEQEISFPLRFSLKLIVEYRPGGVLVDSAPVLYSSDPERAVDEIVQAKGWNCLQGYQPKDVWVDGGF